MEEEVKVNIIDEIHRLVDTKYLLAMEEIVSPETIIDGSYIDPQELDEFKRYISREKDLGDHSGIVNYEACWQPLPQNYFEDRTEQKNGFS